MMTRETNNIWHSNSPLPHKMRGHGCIGYYFAKRIYVGDATNRRFRIASCASARRRASPSPLSSQPHERNCRNADSNGGGNPSIIHPSFLNLSPSGVPTSGARPAASSASSQVSAAGTLSNPAVSASASRFSFQSTLEPERVVDGGHWPATADPADPVAALSFRANSSMTFRSLAFMATSEKRTQVFSLSSFSMPGAGRTSLGRGMRTCPQMMGGRENG
jgi:hypothetical protein